MATHRKEMEVGYFSSQSRAGYGGAGSRAPSTHEHGSFTAVPPAASSGNTNSLWCDLYTGNNPQSHAHKVFDGRSRVSLGQGPGGLPSRCCNNGLETEQIQCVQRGYTDPSDQPPRWRHGHQVFGEMPHSSSGHGQVRGRCCKVLTTSQDPYHSYGSISYVGLQSESLLPSDSGTHQVFETVPHNLKRVLSVKIHNMVYSVTSDVLYQVFSAYGAVEMVIPTTSSTVLIQYQHEEMAGKAHMLLHGRFLYQSCCQLEIRYAHESELDILYSFQCTTQSTLDNSTTEVNHSVVQARSAVEKPYPQALDQSSSTSLNPGISVEQQHHATLDEIITFLAEWRAKIEQREHSRIEQAELKSELEYFLHHAFDIFEEESESEVVLKMERKKKRKQEEQLRIEQEELERELEYFLYHAFNLYDEECESEVIEGYSKRNKRKQEKKSKSEKQLELELHHFLYQAFDMFGEELESVLEKENERIPVKHGAGPVVGLTCGADSSTKCQVPQEYLKLYSQPLSGFASTVHISLNHVLAKLLENQKLNQVAEKALPKNLNHIWIYTEPTLHWEPGDLKEGKWLVKLTVESQFLRREEMQMVSILQQYKNNENTIGKSVVWLLPSTGFAGLPLLWDPGEHDNRFILTSVTVDRRNVKVTSMGILVNLRKLIVFICQDDNRGNYCTQALSISEREGTCAMIAVALMKRGGMLNFYSLEVLVHALPQFTESLHSGEAVMVMGASSGLLPAHILVMDAQKAITFQGDKSTTYFSCKENQPDTDYYNQWDPGILKLTKLTHTNFPGIVGMRLLVCTCKAMTADVSHLTCQEVTLGVDCSNIQIIKCCSDQGALIIEVKPEFSSAILKCPATSSAGESLWLRSISHLAKARACIINIHLAHKVEMVKSYNAGNYSGSTTIFSGNLLYDIISSLANDHIAEFDDLHVGSIEHLHVMMKLLYLRQHAALGSFDSLVQTDHPSFLREFLLEIATNWQWDPGTVTPSQAVLKQSILNPETEYFCQSAGMCSVDSSIQVHNNFSWSKLSLDTKTEWQWYAGIVASPHAVLKLNIRSKGTHLERNQMQAMKSWLYDPGKVIIANNSWRNASVVAELKQSAGKLKICCRDHQQFGRSINQLSSLTPCKSYDMDRGIDVWIISFFPP